MNPARILTLENAMDVYEFHRELRLNGESLSLCDLGIFDTKLEDQEIRSVLLYDERGRLYGYERRLAEREECIADKLKQPRLFRRFASARDAMLWWIGHSYTGRVSVEMRKAVEAAEFPFFADLPTVQPKKRKRRTKKNQAAPILAVQLEMATALVEVVSNLTSHPTTETLSEARRNVTALYRSLHSEEAFKYVANL